MIEILVVIGLSGLLLVLLSQVLLPGFEIWKRTQATSEQEQNMMLCELRLEEAFLQTAPGSITLLDDTDLQAVSFLNHEGSQAQAGYDPITGRAFWRSMTIFKLDRSQQNLTRLRWAQPPLPTTDIYAFTNPELRAACTSGLPERKIAEQVTNFRLQPVVDRHHWVFEIEFEVATPQGPQTVQRDVTLLPRVLGEAE